MLVYRIVLAKYSDKLTASGRAARWNPNDVEMIYTASSRSLACLENVVHRSQAELTLIFNIMTIECPAGIKINRIDEADLSAHWTEFDQMYLTQRIGADWIRGNSSAILEVPSSVVDGEINYLLNPTHADFKSIRIIKNEPFVFDKRIKQ
jgi:RES domain-containing protein